MQKIILNDFFKKATFSQEQLDYFLNEIKKKKFYFKSYPGLNRLGEDEPLDTEELKYIQYMISEVSFICAFLAEIDPTLPISMEGLIETNKLPVFYKTFKLFLVNEFTEFFEDADVKKNLEQIHPEHFEEFVDNYKKNIASYLLY